MVSTLGPAIARVFAAVLAVCDHQGLIGREMFALDGVKLPSNASKHRSGTRSDVARQATKLEAAATTMLERHRATDALAVEPGLAVKAAHRLERLARDAVQIRHRLATHPDERRGVKGAIRKSNRTDNESAKMATGNGVIQGYTGVAAGDAAHQIIVEAQAHGTGSEQDVRLPVVVAMQPGLAAHSLITADAGYHREANLTALAALPVDALSADNARRRRDARFATPNRHQDAPDPRHDQTRPDPTAPTDTLDQPRDFRYDAAARTCVCPQGKSLYRKGRNLVINGYLAEAFRGALRDCVPCPQRARCLRTPDTTKARQVIFIHGRVPKPPRPETHTTRMKRRLDTPEGRARYGQRFGTVEPVFGNLCSNKGLDRFTLRGRAKVDAQWTLFCLVHNIEKLAHSGYAA